MKLVTTLFITGLISVYTLAGDSLPRWHDGKGGASFQYYNSEARLSWDRPVGDWTDAQGKNWGSKAFAEVVVPPKIKGVVITMDVTDLVNDWLGGVYRNDGFYIKAMGAGVVELSSREAATGKPKLSIEQPTTSVQLPVTYDTLLESTSIAPQGKKPKMGVSSTRTGILWFDLRKLGDIDSVKHANLKLTVNRVFGGKAVKLGVFRVNPAPKSSVLRDIEYGLAKTYPGDKGINEDPKVYFATGFESRSWKDDWKIDGNPGKTGEHDSIKHYAGLSGKSLLTRIAKGQQPGMNHRYRFTDHDFPEPEQAYFRYYFRLGDDWNQTISGGKFPGFAGTYNTAGWGSRKPNGKNGWSARGGFLQTIQPGKFGPNRVTPMGSYIYHVDQSGNYGNTWIWDDSGGAMIENNRWYCIEQYLRLNTPGKKDGVLTAWVDGRKVFQRKNLNFRTVPTLKIEEVWFNIFHGGGKKSPHNQTVFIDNIVIARDYIGPMAP